MKGTDVTWREDFFCENMFMGQNYPRMEAVRGERWKYIRYFSKQKDQHHILSLVSPITCEEPVYEELYDLENDPEESVNLAGNPEFNNLLGQFRSRCSVLLKQARGGPSLPDTYIEEWDDTAFRNKVEKTYAGLVKYYSGNTDE
jgi:hypothetical protein